jgi:hypothetical protein
MTIIQEPGNTYHCKRIEEAVCQCSVNGFEYSTETCLAFCALYDERSTIPLIIYVVHLDFKSRDFWLCHGVIIQVSLHEVFYF